MTEEFHEEPAIFQLIRNREVSIDAIRLYLQHYPKILKHPVYDNDTILTVAVKECFAYTTPEIIEDGEDFNAALLRQLSILRTVVDFVAVDEIICGKNIFHILFQVPSFNDRVLAEAEDLSIDMHKLISNEIFDIIVKHIPVWSDEQNILFLRDTESQLALHIAIYHDNSKAARKILSYMGLSQNEYSRYEYIEPDRSIPILHYILMHSPSSKLLTSLFVMFPHSASVADSDGVLPIAVALENSLSCRKIDSIINMYPSALSAPNGDGDLPLHIAAMDCPHHIDVLELLIDRYDIALETPNNNGQLPLHCCLEYENSSNRDEPVNVRTVQLLSNNVRANKDIDEWEGALYDGKLNDDSTTNTSIVSSPSSVLQRTVSYVDEELNESQCSPDRCKASALFHRDCYGEIPLHIASRKLTSCSYEILTWLLESHPSSASSRNEFGHLPMHLLAASECHTADDDTIQRCFDLLLKEYPASVYTQDDEGDIPLQCLLTHQDILPSLLRCFVNSMSSDNELSLHLMKNPLTGHLPIHTACLNGIYSVNVIDGLVSLHPGALIHYDNDGFLPFHVALRSPENCDASVLKSLLFRPMDETSSLACQMSTLPSTSNGVPALFLACENSISLEAQDNEEHTIDCRTLDVIRFLVENSPELFAKRNTLNYERF